MEPPYKDFSSRTGTFLAGLLFEQIFSKAFLKGFAKKLSQKIPKVTAIVEFFSNSPFC
jgi:hypothetical protein